MKWSDKVLILIVAADEQTISYFIWQDVKNGHFFYYPCTSDISTNHPCGTSKTGIWLQQCANLLPCPCTMTSPPRITDAAHAKQQGQDRTGQGRAGKCLQRCVTLSYYPSTTTSPPRITKAVPAVHTKQQETMTEQDRTGRCLQQRSRPSRPSNPTEV